MRKVSMSILGMLFCCLLALGTASTVQAAEKEVELSLNLITPPGHLRNEFVLRPWIDKVKEKSNGTLIITPYYAASMAPVQQAYEAAVNGIADISEGIVYSTPGTFPLTETIMLPDLGFESGLDGSTRVWKAYKQVPELAKEWDKAKVLWLHTAPTTKILTRNKPIRSLEDLKGLKIRVSGSTAVRMAEQLGFTPVSLPMGDLYQALEKGVIDGVLMNTENLVSRRLGEVVKYVTLIPMVNDAFFVVMNKDSWKALSPEHKKILEELSGDWAVEFTGKAWDKNEADGIAAFKDKIEFITLTQAELDKFTKQLAPIKFEYADKMDKNGLPGKKTLDVMMQK